MKLLSSFTTSSLCVAALDLPEVATLSLARQRPFPEQLCMLAGLSSTFGRPPCTCVGNCRCHLDAARPALRLGDTLSPAVARNYGLSLQMLSYCVLNLCTLKYVPLYVRTCSTHLSAFHFQISHLSVFLIDTLKAEPNRFPAFPQSGLVSSN